MALTAREWLLLSKGEQERRKDELSPQECFLLRTDLEYMRFSETEKKNMTKEKREAYLHPKEYTEGEKEIFNQKCREIFKRLSEEAKEGMINTTSR